MAKRGRPRKQGQRTKCGRLKRDNYAPPTFDKGSEWVQAMRAKYQTNYNTALGRAFAAGLLGDDDEAQSLYQGGKRFARIYNRIIGGETYRCPLDRTPRGSLTETDITEQDMRDKEWLFATITRLENTGLRPWLDQLISRVHTDHGPPWLSRLLDGGKDPADQMVLKAAIKALSIVAPAHKPIGIVSAHWEAA